jgi:hypothetical protein
MRRRALGACCVVAVVGLAGCGGKGDKTVVIEPVSPVSSGAYLAITGPEPVVAVIAGYVAKLPLSNESATVVARAQGPLDCTRQVVITRAMVDSGTTPAQAAGLSKYVGKSIRLSVYGSGAGVPVLCKYFGASA